MKLSIIVLVWLLCSRSNAQSANWALQFIEQERSQKILSKAHPVVIAVIDTGLDLSHPQLAASVWTNPGESGLDSKGRDRSRNGRDDDHNGKVDDWQGWNFSAQNSNIEDRQGHGTHVAGLIQSVAPGSRLMILKYYDPQASGPDNLNALVAAIHYANKMGAQIINYSGGGFIENEAEREALFESEKKNILVVAAAGNEATSSDLRPFYPASYPLRNIISVAANDPVSHLVPSSNFGERTVDLAAPGEALLSTLPDGNFGRLTGTSQATALVTGAAALLMSQRPDWQNPQMVKDHLCRSTRISASLSKRVRCAGTLNIVKALAQQDPQRSFSGFKIRQASPATEIVVPHPR